MDLLNEVGNYFDEHTLLLYVIVIGTFILLGIWTSISNKRNGIVQNPMLVYHVNQRNGMRGLVGGIALVAQAVIVAGYCLHAYATNQLSALGGLGNDILKEFLYCELVLLLVGIFCAYWGYRILRTNKLP